MTFPRNNLCAVKTAHQLAGGDLPKSPASFTLTEPALSSSLGGPAAGAPLLPAPAAPNHWLGTPASQDAATAYLVRRDFAHHRRLDRIQIGAIIAAALALSVYLIATTPEPAQIEAGPGFETCTERGC